MGYVRYVTKEACYRPVAQDQSTDGQSMGMDANFCKEFSKGRDYPQVSLSVLLSDENKFGHLQTMTLRHAVLYFF